VHALGDGADAFRSVVDGVHARDDREQRLRRAHVARRLLPADVLLARRQGHSKRRPPVRVGADADDAPGQLPDEVGLAREERRVRTAVTERDAEALGAAEGDVRPELAGRHEDREREQVASHRDERACCVGALDERAPVCERTVGRRVLQERAEDRRLGVERERPRVADENFDPVRGGARAQDVDRLRVARVGHEDGVRRSALGGREHHVHRLGGRRGLVEQRRVRDLERRQVAHHRLEVEQRLEAPLRDLGLVRRVLGVPARVLEHVALDDGRRDARRVAHADVAAVRLVLRPDGAELLEQLMLALRRGQRERSPEADRARDRLVDQLVERSGADHPQHLGDICFRRANVAVDESVGVLQQYGHRVPSVYCPPQPLASVTTKLRAVRLREHCAGFKGFSYYTPPAPLGARAAA
jgi:hypothetical protein